MSELMTAAHAINQMIDEGQIDTDLLGDHELGEVQVLVSNLVTIQLAALDPGDDAEINEENLRAAMETAALKAFVTGLAVAPNGGSTQTGPSISVPAEVLTGLVTQIVRDGSLSITLSVDG